jgi:hypothetical protein
MEKKHTTQSAIRNLLTHAGCSLVFLPLALMIGAMLVALGLLFFQWYFYGEPMAYVTPLQDPMYLVGLGIVLISLIFVLRAAWGNFRSLFMAFNRYRHLRQEKARVNRLMLRDETQAMASENDEMVQLSDDMAQQQMRS